MRTWGHAKGKSGGVRQVRCEEVVFFHPELLQYPAFWKQLTLSRNNINAGAAGWLEVLRAGTQTEGRLHELYSKQQGKTGSLVPIGRLSLYLKRGQQKQKC